MIVVSIEQSNVFGDMDGALKALSDKRTNTFHHELSDSEDDSDFSEMSDDESNADESSSESEFESDSESDQSVLHLNIFGWVY